MHSRARQKMPKLRTTSMTNNSNHLNVVHRMATLGISKTFFACQRVRDNLKCTKRTCLHHGDLGCVPSTDVIPIRRRPYANQENSTKSDTNLVGRLYLDLLRDLRSSSRHQGRQRFQSRTERHLALGCWRSRGQRPKQILKQCECNTLSR